MLKFFRRFSLLLISLRLLLGATSSIDIPFAPQAARLTDNLRPFESSSFVTKIAGNGAARVVGCFVFPICAAFDSIHYGIKSLFQFVAHRVSQEGLTARRIF
jgi:hypothetical protein